jgi:hypothetical protein
MAIFVSMLEFFRSGEFGPLRLNMTRRRIEEIVGPPDDYFAISAKERRRHRREEDHWKYARGWVYGDHFSGGRVELSFDEGYSSKHPYRSIVYDHCLLRTIHIDYLSTSIASGGEKIKIDPWILHPGLSLEDAQTALTQSQLSYHIRPHPFPEDGPGTVHLVLESGVLLYFDVEGEIESRPAEIQLLYFPDSMKDYYDESGNVLPEIERRRKREAMTKKQKIPSRLRVMAEYESSGIWGIVQIGPFRHGMIEHQALGLPPELAQQFDAWIMEYTSQLESPNHPLDVASFNATGRALAEALKRFLGPAYEVEYLPQQEDGSLGAAEHIS